MEEPSPTAVVMAPGDARRAARVAASLLSVMPLSLATFAARWVFGATATARMIRFLRGERIQQMARGLSGTFLARVAIAMNEEERQYAMQHVPFEAVLAATRPLLARNAFDLSALYASALTREHLRQLALQIEDPLALAGMARACTPEIAAQLLMGLSPKRAANVVVQMVRTGFGASWLAIAEQLPEQRLAALRRELPEDVRVLFNPDAAAAIDTVG